MDRKKQLFDPKKQLSTVKKYESLTEVLHSAKNIREWNALRQDLSYKFPGTAEEKVMLFGYIDGVLHGQIFKDQYHEKLVNTI